MISTKGFRLYRFDIACLTPVSQRAYFSGYCCTFKTRSQTERQRFYYHSREKLLARQLAHRYCTVILTEFVTRINGELHQLRLCQELLSNQG